MTSAVRTRRRNWLIIGLLLVGGLGTATLLIGRPMGVIDLFWLAALMEMAAVGALLAYRVPDNPIGWILLCTASLAGWAAIFDVLRWLGWDGAADLKQWVDHWIWIPAVFIPTLFVLLLFPNGRVVTPRWRWAPWTATVGITAFSAATAFSEFLGGDPRSGRNPYFLDEPPWLVDVLGLVGFLCLAAAVIGAAVAMVVRFRRSSGLERLQLKWPTYAATISGLAMLGGFLLGALIAPGTTVVPDAMIVLGLALIPVAIAIALLRYRLYEIDRLINRTIVYAAVTVVLVGIYATLAVALPQILPLPLDSDVSVAAATLAVAGLFRPLTRRVQAYVDRRFFRQRYNAQKTLETLAVRLQGQTDIAALEREVTQLLEATVHPRQVGVWLPGAREDSPRLVRV